MQRFFCAAVTVALFACSGAAGGNNDGGTSEFVDGGVDVDAGPASFGGIWDWGNQSVALPCDGGGYVWWRDWVDDKHEMIMVDGGLTFPRSRIPLYIAIDEDGSAESIRAEMARESAPNHSTTSIYRRFSGHFLTNPTRFEGQRILDAWNGQCQAVLDTHWTQLGVEEDPAWCLQQDIWYRQECGICSINNLSDCDVSECTGTSCTCTSMGTSESDIGNRRLGLCAECCTTCNTGKACGDACIPSGTQCTARRDFCACEPVKWK